MNTTAISYFDNHSGIKGTSSLFNQSVLPDGTSQNSTDVFRLKLVPTIPAVMFGLGVFGNLLALFVLYQAPKEHKKTVFYRLVGGLALNDLFGTTALSPVTFIVYANFPIWPGGQALCDYFSFMLIFAGFSTVFVIAAMALDRYLAIRHPYFYSAKVTYRKVKYIFLISWFTALLFACLPLMGLGKNVKHFPNTWCFFDFYSDEIKVKLFAYLYSSVGLSIILMIAVLNTVVIWTLIKMRKVALSTCSGHGNGNTKNRVDSEIQMMVFVVGVLIVFGICYAPLMVRVLVIQIGALEERKADDLVVVRLASFNQILDPWVYILFRRELFYKCYLCLKGKALSVPVIRRLSTVTNKVPDMTYKSDVTEMSECFSMPSCLKNEEVECVVEIIPSQVKFSENSKNGFCKQNDDNENLLSKQYDSNVDCDNESECDND